MKNSTREVIAAGTAIGIIYIILKVCYELLCGGIKMLAWFIGGWNENK